MLTVTGKSAPGIHHCSTEPFGIMSVLPVKLDKNFEVISQWE